MKLRRESWSRMAFAALLLLLASTLILTTVTVSAGCGCNSDNDTSERYMYQQYLLNLQKAKASPSATTARDLSSPSNALLGHWNEKKGAEVWFSATGVVLRTPCGENLKGTYKVISQNAAGRKGVVEAKFKGVSEKWTAPFEFLNADYTKLMLPWAGQKLEYVDGRQEP